MLTLWERKTQTESCKDQSLENRQRLLILKRGSQGTRRRKGARALQKQKARAGISHALRTARSLVNWQVEHSGCIIKIMKRFILVWHQSITASVASRRRTFQGNNLHLWSLSIVSWRSLSLCRSVFIFPEELKTCERRCHLAPSILNGPVGVIKVATGWVLLYTHSRSLWTLFVRLHISVHRTIFCGFLVHFLTKQWLPGINSSTMCS